MTKILKIFATTSVLLITVINSQNAFAWNGTGYNAGNLWIQNWSNGTSSLNCSSYWAGTLYVTNCY